MSRSASYQYRLEARRRQEARRREVAAMTMQFIDRYTQTLADLSAQGLARFVSAAYQQAENLCRQAETLCQTDPFRARDISRQIGQIMGSLPATARRLRKEEQRREQQEKQTRIREEQQRQIAQQRATHQMQQNFIRAIPQKIRQALPSALSAELMEKETNTIQSRYTKLALQCDSTQLVKLVEQFLGTLQDLKSVAEKRTAAWEEKTRQEIQREIMAEQLARQKEVLASLAVETTRQEIQAEVRKIETLENRIQRKETVTETECEQTLSTTLEAAENIQTEEAVRRETLKSIIGTLKQVGFLIDEPLLRGKVVELSATRPTGERCTFYVDLQGGMEYHFDRYEGAACKKDIQTILPILQNVYGVHLSEEQTLWENPERLDREAQWNSLPQNKRIEEI